METLQQELLRKLPLDMQPGNVGNLRKVTWNYWFNLNIEVGSDPTWSNTSKYTGQFQVDADAAFLLLWIARKSYSDGTAGENAPIQLVLKDTQSSRQFMEPNYPLPLQSIGTKSRPTILPTPFLLLPAAVLQAEITSWVPAPQATVGDGNIQLTFFGYRIRMDNPEKIFSTVYGLGGK